MKHRFKLWHVPFFLIQKLGADAKTAAPILSFRKDWVRRFTRISVALDFAALLIGLKLLNGLEQFWLHQLLDLSPHVLLSFKSSSEREKARALLVCNPNVQAVSDRSQAFILWNNQTWLKPIHSALVLSREEPNVTQLHQFLMPALPDWDNYCIYKNQAILGEALAKAHGIKVGETFEVKGISFHPATGFRATQYRLFLKAVLVSNTFLDHSFFAVSPNTFFSTKASFQLALKLKNPFLPFTMTEAKAVSASALLSWFQVFKEIQLPIQMVKRLLGLGCGLFMTLSTLALSTHLLVWVAERAQSLKDLHRLGASIGLLFRTLFGTLLIELTKALGIGWILHRFVFWILKWVASNASAYVPSTFQVLKTFSGSLKWIDYMLCLGLLCIFALVPVVFVVWRMLNRIISASR